MERDSVCLTILFNRMIMYKYYKVISHEMTYKADWSNVHFYTIHFERLNVGSLDFFRSNITFSNCFRVRIDLEFWRDAQWTVRPIINVLCMSSLTDFLQTRPMSRWNTAMRLVRSAFHTCRPRYHPLRSQNMWTSSQRCREWLFLRCWHQWTRYKKLVVSR